jgi:hypothetical protein
MSSDNSLGYEGIAQVDMPVILEAIDTIMKYQRHKGDTISTTEIDTYLDALLKFSSLAFVALKKLLEYHDKTVNEGSTTTDTKDIHELMKLYSSFYS